MKFVSRAAIALVSFAAFAGCSKEAPPDKGAPSRASADVVAVAPPADASTGGLSRLRTTSAEIALSNLDVQLKSREQMLARNENVIGATRQIIEILLARGEYASRIADYERAAATADAFVIAQPQSPDAHLSRATTLGMFHMFAQQQEELDAAARLKAPADAVLAARGTMLMAQGRFDEADALGAWKDTDALDSMGLATAAVLAGERGHMDESEKLFERARAKFHDVSPFPVAWMDFQRGALLERQGDRTRAKQYFEEAHKALPAFVHPAVHLAGLETPANALAILEPIAGGVEGKSATTDDPQVDVAYADTLRRLGRADDAKAPLARARTRYDELLTKHSLAFADHAAQFYVGMGHDPARALVLARQNAKNRATEPALDLWITAALLANAHDDACAAAAQGAALPYATPAFRATLATTRAGCDGTHADAAATGDASP